MVLLRRRGGQKEDPLGKLEEGVDSHKCGGMGIQDLRVTNMALMVKMIFRFCL